MPRERQLFVAGLSPGYTQEQLYKLFHNFGAIEASSVTTDTKGKTIGFVTFLDSQAARSAETLLHGKRTNGVGPLVVVPALSRSEKNETNSSSVKYQADTPDEQQAAGKPGDTPIISKLQAAMTSQPDTTPPGASLNLAQRQRQKFLAQYQQNQQLAQQQQQQYVISKGSECDIIDKLLAAGMSGDDVSKCMEERKNNQNAAIEGKGRRQNNHNPSDPTPGTDKRGRQQTDDKDYRIQELEREIAKLKETSLGGQVGGLPNANAPLNASLLRNAGKGAPQKPMIPSSLLGNLTLPTMPNLQQSSIQNTEDFQKQLQVLQLQSQLLPQSLLPTTLPASTPTMSNSDALQQAYNTILNHQQQLLLQQQHH